MSEKSLLRPGVAKPGTAPRSGMRWMPSMLRKPRSFSLIVLTVILLASVTIVHVVSSYNSGLGTDDGSHGVLFAWRFLPTAVAVVFNIFMSILLDDVKRTEGLARLTSPKGAPALYSILYVPGSFWNAFKESFPNARKQRRFSPILFCASLAYMLGSFILSPASSVLLASRTIPVESEARFRRMVAPNDVFSQVRPTDEIQFRTISNLIQNASTSPWLTNEYAILPFWPERLGAGPVETFYSQKSEVWRATTTVFTAEMECEPMKIEDKRVFYYHVPFEDMEDSVYQWPVVEFSSASGCNVSLVDHFDAFASWANTSETFEPSILYEIDYLFGAENKRIVAGCSGRENIIHMTASADHDDDDFEVPVLRDNVTAEAWNCDTRYYIGDATVSVRSNSSGLFPELNVNQYRSTRTEISVEIDGSDLNDRFLMTDWPAYLFQTVPATEDSDDALTLDPSAIEGPAAVLGALNRYSHRSFTNAPITEQATRAKQRFFGETLHAALTSSTIESATESGTEAVFQRRVLVISAIAVTIEAVLGCELLLLLAILFVGRRSRRSLGYPSDPAIAITIARSIANEKNTLMTLSPALEASGKARKTILRQHQFGLTAGHLEYLGKADLLPKKPKTSKSKISQPYPGSLRLKNVTAIVSVLLLVVAAIVTLFVISRTMGLYQSGFIYQAEVNLSGWDIEAFNPAALVTTIVAVIISMWWGSIDTASRRMQPYLTLADPTKDGTLGAFLSYQSVYLLWAAFKAWTNRHKMLMLVCIGTSLMQVCKFYLCPFPYRMKLTRSH
jgi:hypothetical protein